MSTKKEKPCCDRCREVSSISGSFNCVGTCQCHQSESIEWEKEKFAEIVWRYRTEIQDGNRPGRIEARIEMDDFISQAITTAVANAVKGKFFERITIESAIPADIVKKIGDDAVAKREKELVDEVEKLHHLHNPPEKELIYLTDVIAILKH